MGVVANMGNAPVVEDSREAGIGVVVDHDNQGAAQVELLHGAQPDALEAAEMTWPSMSTGSARSIHACCPADQPSRLLQREMSAPMAFVG
jgi:hypothetical protein